MLLYKFIKPDGLRLLSHQELKVNPPSKFNDPFEFAPRWDVNQHTKKQAKQWLKRQAKEIYRILNVQENFQKFTSRLLQDDNVEIIIKKLSKLGPNFCKEKFLRSTSRMTAVACFSEHYDNLLMWSHYADAHRGIVIGIKFDGFLKNKGHLLKVSYQKKRAPWNFLTKHNSSAVIKTKWQDWKYEKEWRLLFDLKNCQKRKLKKHNYYFIGIDSKQIKKIFFGQKCPLSLRKRVKKLLEADHLSHVKCLNAETDESEFKLNFKHCL